MRTACPIYHSLGSGIHPRKRHIVFRQPDGALYTEELMGNMGFTGPSSLVYHVHQPTQVKDVSLVKALAWEADPEPTFRNRHFRTRRPARDAAASRRIASRCSSTPTWRLSFVAAARRRRVLLPERAGRRNRLRQRRRGRARVAAGPADVRQGRLPRRPARHRAPLPLHRTPGALPGDRKRRLRAHAAPLPQRARPAHGERAVFASATSGGRPTSRRIDLQRRVRRSSSRRTTA